MSAKKNARRDDALTARIIDATELHYEDEAPPYVERRAEGFADDIERLRAKIKVQEEERKAVKERLERVPHVTFGRYLAYLMRLRRYEAGRL